MKEALDAAASIIEDCQKLLVGHLDRSGRTPQRPSVVLHSRRPRSARMCLLPPRRPAPLSTPSTPKTLVLANAGHPLPSQQR